MSNQVPLSTQQLALVRDPSTTYNKEYTDIEKGEILALHERGLSLQQIAKEIGRSKSGVQSFIERYKKREENPKNKVRTGRPKKITNEMADEILGSLENDPLISKLSLLDSIEVDIHSRTLDRMLRGKGARKWIARKRPKLLPHHSAAQLASALGRENWKKEQRKKFVWSDECSVQSSAQGGPEWVWRRV